MVLMQSTAPVRRTQAERTAETRGKLLDATAACLAQLGYNNTTTTEVCRRAGVSRGALLHHFPTKDELVSAAVEHVMSLRVAEFRAIVGDVAPDRPLVARLETAVDVLWGIYQGSSLEVWFELIVAGRTDPALRRHIEVVDAQLEETIAEVWSELFPPDPTMPPGFYDVAPAFLFAVLDGLVVQRMTGEAHAADRAVTVILTIKFIIRALVQADPAELLALFESLLGDLE